MTNEKRLRTITQLLYKVVEDRETQHRLYKEQNRFRIEISHEISRRVDQEILEGLKREREGNNAV